MYGQDVTVTKVKKNEGYTWGYTTYNGVSGWFVTDFAKLIYKKQSTVSGSNQVTSPTTTPTVKPTVAPTVKPTAAPTVKPTAAPTVKPTTAPTVKPTAAPTVKPTAAPTQPATTPPAKTPTTPAKIARLVVMGDLDGDGQVSVMDATRIQLIIADMYVPTEYMLMVGDYDGDSVFSIMDSACIRHYLAFGA